MAYAYKEDFYDAFQCAGSECPYTCCNCTWKIEVDKKTDAYYQSLDGTFGAWVNERIDRSRDIAYMKMHTNGLCSVLTEEGLCGIQLELGEMALCDTCRSFPRRTIRSSAANAAFISMSPACPVVSRELLTRRKPIRLIEGEMYSDRELPSSAFLRTAFFRSFAVLQDRNRDIAQRQKLFLLLNQALQEVHTAQDEKKGELLLAFFEKPDNYRAMVPPNKEESFQLAGKLRILRDICPIVLEVNPFLESFMLMTRALEYLRTLEGSEREEEEIRTWFRRLDSGRHEAAQENMLVNALLRYYHCGDFFADDFFRKAGFIVLLNQFLRIFAAVGSASAGKLLDIDERSLYSCYLSRGFEHNKSCRERISETLLQNQLLELPFLFQIIS